MTVTPENPIGLDGFEFVEFTSADAAKMTALIEQLGFTACATHPTKAITRYKQGRINLLVNMEPHGQAAEFRAVHGASANGMAFRVADAKSAYELALSRGAKGADASRSAFPNAYVLEGIGGSLLYLIDRYSDAVRRQKFWDSGALDLAEDWARLGLISRRRFCGAASADVRGSVA